MCIKFLSCEMNLLEVIGMLIFMDIYAYIHSHRIMYIKFVQLFVY